MEYTYIFNYNNRIEFRGTTAIGFVDERDDTIYDMIDGSYIDRTKKIGYLDHYLSDKLIDNSGNILGSIDDHDVVYDKERNKVGYLEDDLICDKAGEPIGKVVGPAKRAGAAAFLLMHGRFHSEGTPYYPIEPEYVELTGAHAHKREINWAKDEPLSDLQSKKSLFFGVFCVSLVALIALIMAVISDAQNGIYAIPVLVAAIFARYQYEHYSLCCCAYNEDEAYKK